MSSEENGSVVPQNEGQEPQTVESETIEKLVKENMDRIAKMKKVQEENMKNLKQTVDKCDNNNESEDAVLSHKVNSLNISREEVPAEGVLNILNKENESLRSILAAYDSSSSSSSSSSDEEEEEDSLDSEEDSDDSDSSNSDSVLDFIGESQGAIKKRDKNSSGDKQDSFMSELGLDVLPPVPDLSSLSLETQKEEFFHMGHVRAIIQRIVTVEALPNTPAYDLDTPLFYGEGREKSPLGLIFEVIGQVTSPTYAVRFNSAQDITDAGIEKGIRVFSAPKSSLTNYVFVQELLKMKGSDASWIGDAEMPVELQDFSDDEAERAYKSVSKQNRKRQHGSQERYKKYEKTMNRCNSLNTRVHKLIDARSTVIRGPVFHPTPKADWNNPTFEIPSQSNTTVPVQGVAAYGPSMYDFNYYESGPSSAPKVPHLLMGSNPNIQVYENFVGPWRTTQNNRATTSANNSRVPRNYTTTFYNYPYTATSAKEGDNESNASTEAQLGAWVNIPNMANVGETPIVWNQNVPPPPPPASAPQGSWSVNTANQYQQGDPSLYKYP